MASAVPPSDVRSVRARVSASTHTYDPSAAFDQSGGLAPGKWAGQNLTIADLSMCGYLFFADEIGADGYGQNASAAVDLFLRRLVAQRKANRGAGHRCRQAHGQQNV